MTIYIIVIVLLIAIIVGQMVVIYRLWRKTRRAALGVDEIAEDTLKELYYLSREQPLVDKNSLVRAAGFQPAKLPLILAELQRRGWAQGEDERVKILKPGERRAIELIRAHRLWERYLAEKEGLALPELHDDAMRREHLLTPEETDRLDAQLGFPKFDPHGDPIPPAGGDLPFHAAGSPLSGWPEHRLGLVMHVEDEPTALFNQLTLMGITPGAQVEIDERTPGRVLVWSGRQRLALTPAAAEMISVVDAPPERIPLSEIEVGQAGRVMALGEIRTPDPQWEALGLKPGADIAAVRLDPLGDPITYRVNGSEIAISRAQGNQIFLDAVSIHEIVLPRRPWLAEEYARFREMLQRYGSWTVIKRGLAVFGPAFLISVGYMDPGNWGTDIEGGARFGYQLLWVIMLANLMAILLQTLSAKLGIATGRSLPQVCRDHYPRWLSVTLWVTAELAAMATDLAEFLGGAMGFYLLFHIPLFPAALITGAIISLILLLERYGIRKVEIVIIGLIAIIGFVYMTEIWLSKPDWGAIAGWIVQTLDAGWRAVGGSGYYRRHRDAAQPLPAQRPHPNARAPHRYPAPQAAGVPSGDHGLGGGVERRFLRQRGYPGDVGSGLLQRPAGRLLAGIRPPDAHPAARSAGGRGLRHRPAGLRAFVVHHGDACRTGHHGWLYRP